MNKWNLPFSLESGPVGMGIRKVAQIVKVGDFTDGGAAVGSLQLSSAIPAGAFVIGSKVTVAEGFTGDTSCTLTIGKSAGDDAFSGGSTVNIYSTGVKGVRAETPLEFIASDQAVHLTATSNADWGSVSAGKLLVEVFYLSTEPELMNSYPDKFSL